MSTAGPVQRTMEWLRAQGYTVDKVEHRVPKSLVTRDFMGFADVLAINPRFKGVLAVQATTGAHLAERVAKVQAEPRAGLWLACANYRWVVGWVERGRRWAVRRVLFGSTLDEHEEAIISP